MTTKISKGEVTGTKMIVLWGGPPEWDGHITAIIDAGTKLERWDHVADAPVLYVSTGQAADVKITKERRAGKKVEEKVAEVFKFAGYREEQNAD